MADVYGRLGLERIFLVFDELDLVRLISLFAPGTEVITIGGLIGKVVEVDEQYEEIVLDSEGSLLRFSLQSVSRAYVRPAYVSDDDVDENGNPLPKDEPAQITSNEPESDGSETVVEETSVVETPEDADSSPFETQSK